jgi:hypothetical protein
MPVPILGARVWECPGGRCTTKARTANAGAPAPPHQCRGMNGLTVPMVPEGTKAEARPVERGDYIGNELVQTDSEGRPVMAVETVRDDGQDVAVYAPVAVAALSAPPVKRPRERAGTARGAALNATIRIEERSGHGLEQ